MTIDQDIMQELADMDGIFPDTSVKRNENDVPNGEYLVRVKSIRFKRTEKTSELIIEWKMEVVGGECAGTPLTRANMTRSEQNIEWFRKDLYAAGMDTTGRKLSEIARMLPKMDGCGLSVSVTHKNGRINIYINNVEDLPEEAVAPPVTQPVPAVAPANRYAVETEREPPPPSLTLEDPFAGE